MSETPRTDEAIEFFHHSLACGIDFARKLERELSAAISLMAQAERERDAFVNILTDDRNVVSAIVKLQQWAKEQAK